MTHEMPWDWTRDSELRGWPLTAWVTARPSYIRNAMLHKCLEQMYLLVELVPPWELLSEWLVRGRYKRFVSCQQLWMPSDIWPADSSSFAYSARLLFLFSLHYGPYCDRQIIIIIIIIIVVVVIRYRLYAGMCLKQTMLLGYTVLQLFCSYNLWCM
jgi:hypothetical protein